MTAPVQFHFDFGSPNAYLCHKLLPSIEARCGVAFDYVPVLLGGVFKATNNASPMVQFKDVKNKTEYLQIEMQRFIRRHGITQFQRNPHFPVNTIQIMRGAILAERDGFAKAYIDAVFHHMWEAPKKMDDADTIAAALDQSGFDGRGILAGIQAPEIKQRLVANTDASVARGNFGSPTFFVGNEMFFGKDRLRDVEEYIAGN